MDIWRFEITKEAQLDLAKLDAQIKKRILIKLGWLINNFEYITPIPLGEPLRGFFKLRVGDWRIAYEVEDARKLVTVHVIDRRDKVYKKLFRRKQVSK
ncbi:MAG TPA: type II toxin-antitoxin system RelE/ParE family toxin [Candidatus Paceibacterota bacterium]